MTPGEWIDEMGKSEGQFMRLETTDGTFRSGRISGFAYKSFLLNGKQVKWPIEIEVNGDPNDRISLDCVQKMSIG